MTCFFCGKIFSRDNVGVLVPCGEIVKFNRVDDMPVIVFLSVLTKTIGKTVCFLPVTLVQLRQASNENRDAKL